MAVVEGLIRAEKTGEISFGNYKLQEKSKLDNFEHNGDLYKVKTYKEITKLEKNGRFIYESVPGTAVTGLMETDGGIKFTVEGVEDAQITLELEDEAEYGITIDGENVGIMKTNLSGKLNLSVELDAETQAAVIISKM
ncbi:MAG: endosialidase [Lachnospiraceae bacterium]